MQVRIATASDASTISALCADVQRLHATAIPMFYKPASPETFPAATVCELMASPDRRIFVAEVEGEIAGYVYVELQRQPESPFVYAMDIVYVHHISMRPFLRRSGIGTELMKAVDAWAKERHASTIKLHVCAFNAPAIAFYENSGFEHLSLGMTMQA